MAARARVMRTEGERPPPLRSRTMPLEMVGDAGRRRPGASDWQRRGRRRRGEKSRAATVSVSLFASISVSGRKFDLFCPSAAGDPIIVPAHSALLCPPGFPFLTAIPSVPHLNHNSINTTPRPAQAHLYYCIYSAHPTTGHPIPAHPCPPSLFFLPSFRRRSFCPPVPHCMNFLPRTRASARGSRFSWLLFPGRRGAWATRTPTLPLSARITIHLDQQPNVSPSTFFACCCLSSWTTHVPPRTLLAECARCFTSYIPI